MVVREHCFLSLGLIVFAFRGAFAKVTPSLNPGFRFDYDKPGQALSVPVTSQCERIHLKWSRDGNSTGDSPVAPYFLQVFSSASSVPYVVPAGRGPTFDWDVPFAPNTQYQICMFDVNGVSGGCQQIYTVIANATTTNMTCQTLTDPTSLSVSATVPTGALPQYGYVDQCKILSVTPQSGQGPFTLTVSPSGHPPFNLTSKTKSAINWGVSLPVGSQFFLSLHSADGLAWSNGPVLVGGSGPSSCLAPGAIQRSDFNVYIIGATIGSTCFGLLAGIAAYLLYLRLKPRRMPPSKKYYDHPYLSPRDENSKSVRTATPATSVIGGASSFDRLTSLGQSPLSLAQHIPLPSTPESRTSDLPLRSPTLEPLRPSRQHSRQSSRSRSNLHHSVTPYTIAPSEASSSRTTYPADIKRPFPPEGSLFSTDVSEASSSISSSTGTVVPLQRSVSVRSRAPTYVADPPPLSPPPPLPRPRQSRSQRTRASHSAHPSNATITEDENPPQYGNHVGDHPLNYDPNVLSSGTRL